MDLKGSLVDTNVRIYPSKTLLNYLKTISDNAPLNVLKIVNGQDYKPKKDEVINSVKPLVIHFNEKEIDTLKTIREAVNKADNVKSENTEPEEKDQVNETTQNKESKDANIIEKQDESNEEGSNKIDNPYLTTLDIDWLYTILQKQRKNGGKDVPYLHVLLEGSNIKMPENEKIKRNPILEARCVKLRAQQEAREYRKMTKGVDNVRMRFPEDSISYQLKQVNRQLIAIGQFIISIFAGFLFGFKGLEWMIGSLEFGFRLLMGVMCALIIALAEIYFLAKKLNEELTIPETVQLGGPPKFAPEHEPSYMKTISNNDTNKEHQD